LLSSGQEADFVQHLEDLIRQNPQVPEYWAIRADYFYDAKNWPEAERSLEAVIKHDPENLFARASLGEVNAIQGKLDEGLARMKEVLSVDPSQIEALYGLISITELQGRRADGEQMIFDFYDRHPQSANVAMVVSDIFAQRHDWAKRREVLAQAIQAEPDNPGPYRLLAAEAFRGGRYEEALKLGESSLARDQQEESRRSTLDVVTEAALKSGDIPAAEKFLAMKKKENPFDLGLKEQEQALSLLKQQ
jgi:cytochrome c-type biogenesis protein CcmH/NrfG